MPGENETLARALELLRLINGNWPTQAIAVAAELRLMDHLARGLGTPIELADATQCHEPSLRRLLRALATLGLCRESEDGAFELSATGSMLRSDAPLSLHAYSIRYRRYQWPAWGKLLDSVKTGACARTLLDGTTGFEHLERDAAAASVYHQAMAQVTKLIAETVVPAYAFSQFGRIVDIAGGYGEMLATILRSSPTSHGVLYERPAALEGARGYLRGAGVADRCEFVAGDIFESIPPGAHGYVLKSVLHDWSDDRAALILRRCRQAMRSEAKLLLVEYLMPEIMDGSIASRDAARSDLNMLVMLGGRERTANEYRELLHAAGLRVTRVITTELSFGLIEAVPKEGNW